MAGRRVLIQFNLNKDNQFEAEIQKIIDHDDELTRQYINQQGVIRPDNDNPATLTLSVDTIRQHLPNLSQKERQDLYRLLHDGFGCRMY